MNRRTNNPASGIRGKIVGKEPKDEREHFVICSVCGQAIDMRELGEVFHHAQPGHAPLPVE